MLLKLEGLLLLQTSLEACPQCKVLEPRVECLTRRTLTNAWMHASNNGPCVLTEGEAGKPLSR